MAIFADNGRSDNWCQFGNTWRS